jgi:hypothetical protein
MAQSPHPVPPGTRLLHIGPQKTGSTAIQVALHVARDELETHGVHYATGGRVRPAAAGWAFGLRGRPAGSARPPMKYWHQLVAQVAASEADRVLVSNEDFSRANPEQIPEILEAFGGADRIRVVLAARRLDLFLPSQWQERVKAGDTRAYDEWLRVVLDRTSEQRSWDRWNVWRSHDLELLVSRWAPHIDLDRITVVMLDESDRRQLPAAFELLLGLPADTIRPVSTRSNRGLTWGECEMFRGINEAFAARGWPKDVRRRFIRGQILTDLRERTPPPGPKSPPLPDWAAGTLRELSEQRIEWLAGSGVDLIGDLDVLRVPTDVVTASDPFPEPQVPRQAVGDVVMALIAAALALEEAEAAHVGDIGFDDEDKGAEVE